MDPAGTMRAELDRHYRTLQMMNFPHLPYEVTGDTIEVELRTPRRER
jgi:hypothetical protein